VLWTSRLPVEQTLANEVSCPTSFSPQPPPAMADPDLPLGFFRIVHSHLIYPGLVFRALLQTSPRRQNPVSTPCPFPPQSPAKAGYFRAKGPRRKFPDLFHSNTIVPLCPVPEFRCLPLMELFGPSPFCSPHILIFSVSMLR